MSLLDEKQKKTSRRQEGKKTKQSSPKKAADTSASQNAVASQGAPAAKPKRYSSQRQRATQPVPLPVHQAMMPQMGAMYPDQAAYYEQMGELREQYFHVVLFIFLYKVVLTFKSVYENLMCDHSNESY